MHLLLVILDLYIDIIVTTLERGFGIFQGLVMYKDSLGYWRMEHLLTGGAIMGGLHYTQHVSTTTTPAWKCY